MTKGKDYVAVPVAVEATGKDLPMVGVGGLAVAAAGANAPASAAAPYLDINPSNTISGASEGELPKKWTPQQFKIRALFSDRLAYWQTHGFEVHWVTLSSPFGPCRRTLREDFGIAGAGCA